LQTREREKKEREKGTCERPAQLELRKIVDRKAPRSELLHRVSAPGSSNEADIHGRRLQVRINVHHSGEKWCRGHGLCGAQINCHGLSGTIVGNPAAPNGTVLERHAIR